jgi:hypothetical protein
MGKVLLVVLVAFAGWLLLKGLLKGGAGKPKDRDDKASAANEKMVQCQRCGVFMPESESMSTDGKLSCRRPDACLHRQSA